MTWTMKDPAEVLDYQIDWSTRLDTSDTITGSATWTVPSGITKDSQGDTTTTSTITLSGGTAGEQYSLSATVVTTGGDTHQEFVQLFVVDKAAVAALDATVGGASSNTFGTLAGYYTFAIDRGWAIDAGAPSDLMRAADWITRQDYVGYRTEKAQALEFPRVMSQQVRGWYVDSDVVPDDIKNAQYELAYLIQGGLDPFKTVKGAVKSAGAGPTRVEFMGGYSTPRVIAIERLLAPYRGHGNNSQVRVSRG